MHDALYVQEILLNIFGRCCPPESVAQVTEKRRYTADLAALASTCRTFKDPALDLLWLGLDDLSPLARCLPDACRSSGKRYSFNRPPNDAEWDTLRGYTHRVGYIHGFSTDLGSLDDDAIRIIFNPPLVDPLFPNLRALAWRDVTRFPVAHLAVPLLASLTLHVHFYPGGGCLSRHFLDAASELCPNIKRFRIYMTYPHPLDKTISRHVCRWTNLEIVDCPNVDLNADAILRLASMSTLTWLSFMLSTNLAEYVSDLYSLIVFSNVVHVEIASESLDTVVAFLSHVQFPVLQDLGIKVSTMPSKPAVETYMTIVRNVCLSDTLVDFTLLHTGDFIWRHIHLEPQEDYELSLDVLLPCMVFPNLRVLHVNLKSPVNLTDDDVHGLAASLPHLERLVINDAWGWRTERGISLWGLLGLLRLCRSLHDVCLALDTPTYVGVPERIDAGSPALSGKDEGHRRTLCLNVVDSEIEAANVPTLVEVFTTLELDLAVLLAWSGADMKHLAGARVARGLWEDVHKGVKKAGVSTRPSW